MSLKAHLQHLLEIVACRPLLTRKDLAQRYAVETRTVDNWHANGILPRAVYLQGCREPRWRPMDLAAAERRTPKLSKRANKS